MSLSRMISGRWVELEDGVLTIEGLISRTDVVFGRVDPAGERRMYDLMRQETLCSCNGTLAEVFDCSKRRYQLNGVDSATSIVARVRDAIQDCASSGVKRYAQSFKRR